MTDEPRSHADRRQPLGVEVTTLVNPRTGTLHQIPLECTQTPTRPCGIVTHLSILNELLVSIRAEVKEMPFRKIAITERLILLQAGNFNQVQAADGAVTLLCLLLKHHCVDAMDLQVILKLPLPTALHSIFWDALRSESRVTSLELVGCVPRRTSIPSLIIVLSDLLEKQLIELTLSNVYMEGLTQSMVDTLEKAFRCTRTLRTLSVSHVGHCAKTQFQGLTETDKLIDQAILQGIADNPLVTNLTFSICYPRDACEASIRRLLKSNTVLTDLTISHWALHDRATSVKDVIGELSNMRTLTRLTLTDLQLTPLDKEKLAELLSLNSRLEFVVFLTCRTSSEEASTSQVPRPHVHALVKALKKTTCLERLVLNWSFSVEEIRLLAQAVQYKLRQLLYLLNSSFDKPESFLGILDGVDGSRNVKFGELSFPEGPFLPMIPTRQVAAKQLRCSCTIYDISLKNLCRVLAGDGGDRIRWLELRACANFCPEVRHYLASYLASTSRLEIFLVEIKDDEELLTAVFHGIAHNSSIEHLQIYAGCNIDERNDELFSAWLSSNRRLYSVEIHCSRGTERFAQALAHSMHHNITLLCIDLHLADGPYYEHLRNLTWRNECLLHSAVGFVLGCTQMRAAKAYGLLARHPRLLETVQKRRSLSNRELRAKIRTAENLRCREFWRHAGIVRGELVCNQPQCDGDGQLSEAPLQLDQLGPYLLDHICSFLTLADVPSEHEELQGWPGQLVD